MRIRLWFTIATALALLQTANAQTPKAELFGGYSYQKPGTAGMNGAIGSVSINPTSWLGLVAEVSWNSSSFDVPSLFFVGRVTGTIYSYQYGPRLYLRSVRPVTPFAHVLAGVNHSTGTIEFISNPNSGQVSIPTNRFQFTIGGGLDVSLNRFLAARIVQLDFIHSDGGIVFGDPLGSSNYARNAGGLMLRIP